MDEITKSRLRLWLRSERAMGLPMVGPVQFDFAVVPIAPQTVAPVISEPVARRAPAVQPTARPAPQPVTNDADSGASEAVSRAEFSRANDPFGDAVLSPDGKRVRLATLDETHVIGCTKCKLCETRDKTVFGEGDADARLMFIGEGPGAKEDQTGRPFVGPAGELLTRIIGAMGLKREQVYIANTVKCRAFLPGPPAKDRAPAPDEMAACTPYLEQQVEIIRPSVIVTLGVPASQWVLQTKSSMSRMRGQWHAWRGIKVMPTWHPAYLLRCEKDGNVEPKRQVWADLQLVMGELGLTALKRG